MESKVYIDNSDFSTSSNQIICYKINKVGQYFKIEKVEDKIIFTTNYVSCSRIAFSKYDNNFIFDLGNTAIKNFIETYFPEDTQKTVDEAPYCRFKQSVRKDYELNHVEFIENWSKVIINSDGSFIKEDYSVNLYSVELKDAYDLIYELLLKYKKAAIELITDNAFVPTITGGLDTRCLSSLWRYENDLPRSFYVREVKNDGKNHVELGQADYECALLVTERLHIKSHQPYIFPNQISISGMYTEAARGMYGMSINNPDFVYKFIQHQIKSEFLLYPFADDLFLQIKHPDKNVCRVLLALILCPDLLDIPLIGTQKMFEQNDYKPYNFYEYYKEYIPAAKEIMDYWGEEKCKKLQKL